MICSTDQLTRFCRIFVLVSKSLLLIQLYLVVVVPGACLVVQQRIVLLLPFFFVATRALLSLCLQSMRRYVLLECSNS